MPGANSCSVLYCPQTTFSTQKPPSILPTTFGGGHYYLRSVWEELEGESDLYKDTVRMGETCV